MSGEAGAGPGLGDLEKELTCSICTELLYQPLTLLDCLHTFCGSCLKEWFHVQGSRRRRPSSSPKFTCPSCRAAVRETRPNATVTTLLDIILAANPHQHKSPAEKEEVAQKYKPGDSVFPADSDTDSDQDDRRMVDQARNLSLQEGRSRTRETRHQAPRSRPRRTERTDGDRARTRRDEERSGRRQDRGARRDRRNEAMEQTRRIEHQSSLRSLLSLSDSESMEEEILRQILEEGLLDDIDMDNLGPRQEEELSERIAEAYRRRHRLRLIDRVEQREARGETAHPSASRPRARSHSTQRSTVGPPPRDSSRPPASRPYLFDPLVTRSGPSTQQRRVSEGSRRTSSTPANPASSSEAVESTTRSSSDMTSERPHTSRAELPTTRRRQAMESERNAPHIRTSESRERGRSLTNSPTSGGPHQFRPGWRDPPVSSSVISSVDGPVQNGHRPSSSRSNGPQPVLPYVEPYISCDRCGKVNIQYELHKTCAQCNDGDYHICLRCYRTGRGCLDWSGFGPSAQISFERILAMANNEQPPSMPEASHILLSSRYERSSGATRRATNDDRQMTSDDPARRLQTGLFCDICRSETDDCFWKCDQCNEGDWGFCNRCVNQGRCCTHPLLPICRITTSTPADSSTVIDTSTSPLPNNQTPSETFKILAISTNCDICSSPIPASTSRFHCQTCNGGDYDVCTNCYLKLGATGKISKDNGHNGWRRCPRGHRMVVVGFGDSDNEQDGENPDQSLGGQRRVIVRNLVGGRALKDDRPAPFSPSPVSPEVGTGDWSWKEGSERRKKASRVRGPWSSRNTLDSTATAPTAPAIPQLHPISGPNGNATRRFPPDGGVGVIAHALWSWYPEDTVQDELMFPRGAEITEAENINDDWFWGCYAGFTGLFPGKLVRVVGEVV